MFCISLSRIICIYVGPIQWALSRTNSGISYADSFIILITFSKTSSDFSLTTFSRKIMLGWSLCFFFCFFFFFHVELLNIFFIKITNATFFNKQPLEELLKIPTMLFRGRGSIYWNFFWVAGFWSVALLIKELFCWYFYYNYLFLIC